MNSTKFEWAIIGAGPAGILALGKLLDSGVHPKTILWLDPAFEVGDLGLLWSNVSSNTTVKLFLAFLYGCASFQYKQTSKDFAINHLNPEETCELKHIVEPLQWITEQLMTKAECQLTMVNQLTLNNRMWHLSTNKETFLAKKVILAIGAEPMVLDKTKPYIPLSTALNPKALAREIHLSETIGVFGSSHSAILILEQLVNLGVKKIINFYRSPCCYAFQYDGQIIFDNTGLKGKAAEWAHQYIDGILPQQLERHMSNPEHIDKFLPQCQKVIYAVGFQLRNTLIVEHYDYHQYNPFLGIIAPGYLV